MSKVIKRKDLKGKIKDNQSIMVGGFLECGTPERLIDVLLEDSIRDITLIANDTGFTDKKFGSLIVQKRVKKVIASHIGTNRETGRQMNEGEIEVELVPQGTLAERIRSYGAGLGGFYTPTGVGTVVEEGKEKKVINGREYILEKPLGADVALIKAWKADEAGNLIYRYSARNFNPLMAMAADLVIVETEEIVPIGSLDPNEIMTPGIFVDYIVDFS
ncbi:MAG: acetate CoA/acetoacetate CoA-transferase alpha subunit [Halanaerobiales bacterium]|nr:acetate CoA/acetoacetate CoA-transferase alpha subunit [Halanaerobiales bacterium]